MAIATPNPAPPAPAPPWQTSTPPWRGPVLVGIAASVGTLLVTIGDPNTTHVPLCPLKAVSGLDCAFCGSLRATHSLTHGDLAGALDHNILFTLISPLLVVGWAVWLLRSLGHDVLPRVQVPRWAMLSMIAVALAFSVMRNLPAFAWFAST